MRRIKWNRNAFAEIRTSPETNAALKAIADDIREEVSDPLDGGYASGVDPGRNRSRGYVVTTTLRAMRDESKDHTLLRALAKRAVGT